MSRRRRFDKELVTPNLTAFTSPMLSVNDCATGSFFRHSSRAAPRGGQIEIVTSPRISRRLASKSSDDTALTASNSKDACVTLLTPQLCHDTIPAYTSACGGDVAPCFGAARHTHTHAWSLVLSGSSANSPAPASTIAMSLSGASRGKRGKNTLPGFCLMASITADSRRKCFTRGNVLKL